MPLSCILFFLLRAQDFTKCHVALHCIDTTGLFVGGEPGLLRRWHGVASGYGWGESALHR